MKQKNIYTERALIIVHSDNNIFIIGWLKKHQKLQESDVNLSFHFE